MPPAAVAQPNTHYVMLYAHSYGASAILNALPQWAGQKAADITKGLTFRLSPALGNDLQIYGAITFALYLRASGTFTGTVGVKITELTKDGKEIDVPSARVDTSPLTLRTTAMPVTVGVGTIDYKFGRGSAIVLHVGVDQGSGSGVPLLVWDDAGAPTSVRLPTISPATATLSFKGQPSFGNIFRANTNGSQALMINAQVQDAIGSYRFRNASLQVTASNGTNIEFQLESINNTDYMNAYSVNAVLTEGRWQVTLLLNDLAGDSYSFNDYVWVSRFYPVTIIAVGSDGTYLQNATMKVSFGIETSWTAITNSSGQAFFSLPSTAIVGPMNLTVNWLGTRTLFPLETETATTFVARIHVLNLAIRVVMNALPMPILSTIPVPAARVALYQNGVVQEALTGPNGTAVLHTIPEGIYTVRVDYLFATYQASLTVSGNSGTTLVVPFPHRTITLFTSLAILAFASVVLVRKRRGKLYPRTFGYFNELTHGGLPEACFAVIAGDSGSGKSVLLNSLAAEHLATAKAVYVTNTEYPDRIRDSLLKLGIVEEKYVKDDRLVFIDAYSAVGGGSSKETFSVSSHTDLTNLGLSISKCLELTGPRTDVYLDSLNPMITALRIDYLINFLQSIAARVKANGGKFCITVGAGIEKNDLAKLEQASDCVIETQLQESASGQRRRMRIKKLRDKPYVDRWTRFRVEAGKGIIFLTRSKPNGKSTNPS